MSSKTISKRIQNLERLNANVFHFAVESDWARHKNDPGACDFAVGNPHEMPLAGFVAALQKAVVPQSQEWFAYKDNEIESRKTVAAGLLQWRGVRYDPNDIFMTNGAFGAIVVALDTLVDPGDEVIFISPPWFFYETMITAAGGTPVRVKCNSETFDLDLAAIQRALNVKTRAIIINSPNNPTGKIYPAETLQALGKILTEASAQFGRAIYLLSDEAYSRIIYDGKRFVSPTEFYPNSLLLYTYGKTLLSPGQRIGYIALPPTMPDREELREGIFTSQLLNAWGFPNALLQHALPDLEKLSIDIPHLQAKRDHMVGALREIGYEVHSPEGTFYLLPRAPIADDLAFTKILADEKIFVLPGTVVEFPGHFRISLTANDEMIERSLPGFQAALKKAKP